MKIIVLLKPVPDLSKLKVSRSQGQVLETGKRVLNTYDRSALQLAVDLKKERGGMIAAVSVCRDEDNDILREAFASGADSCYQLSDPQFLSNDALANTIVLSRAISKLAPYDLILCGARSDIGYSGQTGPRVAELLALPQATSVTSVSVDDDYILTVSAMNGFTREQKLKLPFLLSVERSIREPKIPNALLIMKAFKKEIVVWNSEDLGLPADQTGVQGSMTKIFSQYLAETV